MGYTINDLKRLLNQYGPTHWLPLRYAESGWGSAWNPQVLILFLMSIFIELKTDDYIPEN